MAKWYEIGGKMAADLSLGLSQPLEFLSKPMDIGERLES
jgi:hypothetical protein